MLTGHDGVFRHLIFKEFQKAETMNAAQQESAPKTEPDKENQQTEDQPVNTTVAPGSVSPGERVSLHQERRTKMVTSASRRHMRLLPGKDCAPTSGCSADKH